MKRKDNRNTFTVSDPTLILQALVSLKDARVLEYERDRAVVCLRVEQIVRDLVCPTCAAVAWVKDRPEVSYIDLPVYGKPMRLVWRKHRLKCPNPQCQVSSWINPDPRIAPARAHMTTRAAKWATKQVGIGRTIKEVALELGCDWHTINDTITKYGQALLEADKKRLNKTHAIGLDETSFVRINKHHTQYVTTVCDVENHQIIDIIPDRTLKGVGGFLRNQSENWKRRIDFGTLDMSTTYQAIFTVVLPKATQVVDHFHVIKHANQALDEVRRRVQRERTGHRGRRGDPLYKIRRTLLKGEEKLSDKTAGRLESLLSLGDPGGEVALAYRVKERLRDFYKAPDQQEATAMLTDLITHCKKASSPPEIQKLGHTLAKWFTPICNYHLAHHSNGITEAMNNLIKRIKRIGFGFTNFNNYQTRVLLYAGKPHWKTLNSITIP